MCGEDKGKRCGEGKEGLVGVEGKEGLVGVWRGKGGSGRCVERERRVW